MFLTTLKYTPVSRAFLRIAVIWLTVVPAYSAATREWAFAATSASSATTSCFWDRLRAIALLQLNSAHGSCRLRSWAAPFPRCRGRRMASRWWPFQKDFPERAAPSTQARPSNEAGLSDPACTDGDSLPVSSFHARRRYALTAPAVFDGYRVGAFGAAAAMPSKLADRRIAVAGERVETNYFSASEDWSTVTPGPMVELSEIFCRYWPLAVDGLALIRSSSSACRLLLQRGGVEAGLADRAVDDAGLVGAVTHLAAPWRSCTASAGFGETVPTFGFGIRPRGPSTWPSLPTTRIASGVAMTTS